MRKFIQIFAIALLGIGLFSCAKKQNRYELIPYPNQLEPQSGRFAFVPEMAFYIAPECGEEASQLMAGFAAQVATVSGKQIVATDNENAAAWVIRYDETQPAEGYNLSVSRNKVVISASAAAGVRFGLQTVKQLLPVAIYGDAQALDADWSVPCVTINDAPRFTYRGLHIDVARHFFTTDEVKRILNVMAAHKLNVLHWHLTDDQGWRIEIKKYPLLTEVGSIRNKTMIRKEWDNYDNTPHGGFYTQDELRDMVQYAANLGITIIPEVDLPGHMMAAMAAYPSLGCTGGPYEVSGQWGVRDDVLCVGKEETFTFIENVLLEVIDIFPSKYIHIGGDECPKVRWEKCPACQARIKKLGLKDDEHGKAEHYLQSYTTQRVEEFLNQHGRSIIGWDEILEGGLATNATVMSWRGTEGGIEAVKQGHQAIMTPTTPLYLDYYQTNDTENEPLAIGGHNPVSAVYQFDPIAPELTPEQAALILGVQANLWTEYITEPEQLEYMLLPRLAALSEVQWTLPENKDYDRFLTNISHILEIYDVMGLTYAKHIFEVMGDYIVNEAQDGIEVTLRANGDSPIYYTLDGSDPATKGQRYSKPFVIKPQVDSCVMKAVVKHPNVETRVLQRAFHFSKSSGHLAVLAEQPSEKYAYNGATVLTDGIRGDFNYANGCWLGFIDSPIDAVIDLHATETISAVKVGNLVQYAEYIFPPTGITVYIPDEAGNWTEISKLDIPTPAVQDEDGLREYACTFEPVETSKIRVVVNTTSSIPAWHGAQGQKGWLFVDEIVLE